MRLGLDNSVPLACNQWDHLIGKIDGSGVPATEYLYETANRLICSRELCSKSRRRQQIYAGRRGDLMFSSCRCPWLIEPYRCRLSANSLISKCHSPYMTPPKRVLVNRTDSLLLYILRSVATYRLGDAEPHFWEDPHPSTHKVSLSNNVLILYSCG